MNTPDSGSAPRPFEGVRVIDMTRVLAGPFAAHQLAMLGADVIKAEGPRAPDMTRSEGAGPRHRRAQRGHSRRRRRHCG